MSYETLSQQVNDQALLARINAGAMKETLANAAFGATDFGRALLDGRASAMQTLAWPVAVDTEAAYEYAVNAGNPNPGGDPTVITDAQILGAVQAHWPPDPWPVPAIPPTL